MEDKFRNKNIDGIAGEPVNFSEKESNIPSNKNNNLLSNRLLSYSLFAIALCLSYFAIKSLMAKEATPNVKKLNDRVITLERKVKELEEQIIRLEQESEKKEDITPFWLKKTK